MDPQILGLVISNLIFEEFGFGPSASICEPFARQVLGEAASVNYELGV